MMTTNTKGRWWTTTIIAAAAAQVGMMHLWCERGVPKRKGRRRSR
jgi:hypothetical protein